MKLTEIAADTLSVRALIAAAEDVQQLLGARNVRIGAIDGTLVVYSTRATLTLGGVVAVTVEDPPRLVTVTTDDAPEPDTINADEDDDDNPSGPCRHAPGRTFCVCLRYCCSARDGRCICRDCIDGTHVHG